MQVLFQTALQPVQNAARFRMPRLPSDVGFLGSIEGKPESETTGRYKQRSLESAARDSLKSYSRTGDRVPSMRPQHSPGPQPKDTPDNPLLFRDAL